MQIPINRRRQAALVLCVPSRSVLVTGGGFIGSHMVWHLIDAGLDGIVKSALLWEEALSRRNPL